MGVIETKLRYRYGNKIYNFLNPKTIGLISGLRSSGKTTLMKYLSSAIITGKEFGGFIATPSTVRILDTEQAEDLADNIKESIRNNSKLSQVEFDKKFAYDNLSGVPFNTQKWQEVQDIIANCKEEYIILDNVSGISSNMNDTSSSTEIVSVLNSLAHNYNKIIICLSHVSQEGKSWGVLGTLLENLASSIFMLERDLEEGYTIVTNKKNRYDDDIPTFDFTIVGEEILLGPYQPFPPLTLKQ